MEQFHFFTVFPVGQIKANTCFPEMEKVRAPCNSYRQMNAKMLKPWRKPSSFE